MTIGGQLYFTIYTIYHIKTYFSRPDPFFALFAARPDPLFAAKLGYNKLYEILDMKKR